MYLQHIASLQRMIESKRKSYARQVLLLYFCQAGIFLFLFGSLYFIRNQDLKLRQFGDSLRANCSSSSLEPSFPDETAKPRRKRSEIICTVRNGRNICRRNRKKLKRAIQETEAVVQNELSEPQDWVWLTPYSRIEVNL